MNRTRRIRGILLAGCVGVGAAFWVCLAAESPQPTTAGTPPIPTGIILNNPFRAFRELLASATEERELILEKKPAVHRKHLEERLREFESIPVAEREVRLQMMELRWFLVPLFGMPPTSRIERLAAVPDGIRKLVEDRLMEWDALPTNLRQEVLQHGITLQYFARLENAPPTEQVKLWNSHGRESKPQPAMSPEQWRNVMAARKQNVSSQLERFFELSAEEKQKTLRAFSDGERKHVDIRLKQLEQLPALQRKQCLDSFQKYSEMSENARKEFLKNAERWRAMPVEERKAWRSLITKLPPLPPGLEAKAPTSKPGKLIAADPDR